MPRSIYKNMDPLEIESRFSTEKGFFFDQDESRVSYEDFEPFIHRLPQREKDLIDMYFRNDKKQKEIAKFFGVTQGAISHRLSRACKRLRFLRDMPKVRGDLRDALSDHFEPFEVDLIVFMIDTTCQSKTAHLMNSRYKLRGHNRMTQVKIRHKFDRYIDRIKKLSKKHQDMLVCLQLMEYVRKNLYMMHEVILPHFDRGYKAKYVEVC